MFNKSNNLQDLEKSERESRIKEKFEKVRQFAIKNDWLFLVDFKETEDDYPSFTCLTSVGVLIEVGRDDINIIIDNSSGKFDVNLPK